MPHDVRGPVVHRALVRHAFACRTTVPGTFLRNAVGGAALLATVLLAGCGPEFFKAKGTVSSDGGPLKAWSGTPLGCSRGAARGEPGKILTFQFGLPPGFEAAHPKGENAPEQLAFAQNGSGVMGSLQVFAEVKQPGAPDTMQQASNGFTLDNSNCKTITLDRQEQSKSFAESVKPLKGHLVLDCNVQGSRITADLTFRHCGI